MTTTSPSKIARSTGIAKASAISAKLLVQSSPLRVYTVTRPVEVDLDPVAVVFDFVKPLVALGRLGFQGRELGLDESRHV
jgi:hypothetical protein